MLVFNINDMAVEEPLIEVAVLCPLERDRLFAASMPKRNCYKFHFLENKWEYSSRLA